MKTYAFVDASNLFYGGEKSLGWKIDYKKLAKYLRNKYKVSKIFYFGGVETYQYGHNYLKEDNINIRRLKRYLIGLLKNQGKNFTEAQLILFDRHLRKVKFYFKLQEFGYTLILKPVKVYHHPDGSTEKKANCDVDMTFWLMREKEKYHQAVILSGDGDFLPVLKYLLTHHNKKIHILARGKRTAKEIRQFAGNKFTDFEYLKYLIGVDQKK